MVSVRAACSTKSNVLPRKTLDLTLAHPPEAFSYEKNLPSSHQRKTSKYPSAAAGRCAFTSSTIISFSFRRNKKINRAALETKSAFLCKPPWRCDVILDKNWEIEQRTRCGIGYIVKYLFESERKVKCGLPRAQIDRLQIRAMLQSLSVTYSFVYARGNRTISGWIKPDYALYA